MPTYYRPPNASSFLGDSGGGGSSVADLIMRRGQAQADAELRGAQGWSDAIGGITSALSGAAQQFKTRRDDEQAQKAVNDAAAPGADIRSILGSIADPAVRARAQKGIQDWQEFSAKRQESNLRIKELQEKIAGAQQERQQHDADKLAVAAHNVSNMFDTAGGAVAGANMLYTAAKQDGLADNTFDDFMSGVNDAWGAAKGDPKNEAMFLDALKTQASPILQRLMSAGSASVQEKFKPEVEKITTLNADGSETTELVPKQPGISRTGAPKPDARSLDVQRAEALARGDAPKAASLLEQMRKDAEARRDPNVAAARADAAAARETARNDTRSDKSYQFNSAELERTAKPLTDQAERFGRLVATVNQKTPQADALIAPELLTVMAGGSGSGLRMNEAEISRILGGRTNLESVKAALNKWQVDPSKGLSITDAQRTQIQALIGDMNTRIQKKAAALDEARTALYNTEDPTEHRKIMADLKRKLADTGSDSGGGPKQITSKADFDALPSGTEFIAPDGSRRRKP